MRAGPSTSPAVEADFDASIVPVRRPADHELASDGQLAMYRAGSGLVVLNETARAIWEHCDGATSLGAVVDRLTARYCAHDEELRHDVWATYLHLAELGLLRPA